MPAIVKIENTTGNAKEDAEIDELANKIKEQNRQRLAYSAQHAPNVPQGPVVMARPGQPNIMQYCNKNGSPAVAAASASSTAAKPAAADQIDEESKKGRFGWFDIDKVFLPYMFRYTSEKYTSVRMVERKLLNKFLQVLPPEVKSCTQIRSYYITEGESKLLNEINVRHSDSIFGKEAFTTKDLVVKLNDAREFHKFLDLCHKKLVMKKSNASDRCGFFRINGESVVPYTVKDGVKFVPLFYFEGETSDLKLNSDEVDGWDLAYLKFCCKVQGIRNELFNKEKCKVVALNEIKGHFPAGTTFEDYWPAKGSIEPVTQRHGVNAGNWTQKPAAQQVNKQQQQQQQQQQLSAAQQVYRLQQQISQQTQQQQLNSMSHQQLQQQLALQGLQAQGLQGLQLQQLQASQIQQLMRAGLLPTAQQMQSAQTQQMQSAQRMQSVISRPQSNNVFPGKLTQIKEFPIETSKTVPYKLQKALIHEKIVPCINVRPYLCNDLMMTLPDFVKHFDFPMDKSREILDILKVILYKGNKGHLQVLRSEGKCAVYDPVPLVLVKDVMSFMPQIKYMFNNSASSQPAAKRVRVA